MHNLHRDSEHVALFVRVVQPLAYLHDNEARGRHRDFLTALFKSILKLKKIASPDVLHSNEVSAVDLAEFVNLPNVCVG